MLLLLLLSSSSLLLLLLFSSSSLLLLQEYDLVPVSGDGPDGSHDDDDDDETNSTQQLIFADILTDVGEYCPSLVLLDAMVRVCCWCCWSKNECTHEQALYACDCVACYP